MAVPTNRATDDTIEAADINAIAALANTNETAIDALGEVSASYLTATDPLMGYGVGALPNGSYAGTSAITLSSGRSANQILTLQRSIEVVSGCIVVSSASAGGAARFGIYEYDVATQTIGTLMADFGSVDISSTGTKTATLGAPVTLGPGDYALRFVNDAAGSVSIAAPAVVGAGPAGFSAGNVSNSYRAPSYYQATTDQSAEVAAGLAASPILGNSSGISTVPGRHFPFAFNWNEV